MSWRAELDVGNLTADNLAIAGQPIKQTDKIETFYVDRNRGASGKDGGSWGEAFKTIGEAVTQVNTDYTNAVKSSYGRMREIVIAEGWYSETTMTLTASDVLIRGVGGGRTGTGTILYGSLTAGGWDDGNTGPALAITGWNNEIRDMGFVNRSATIAGTYANSLNATEHPCILEGTYATPVNYNTYRNLTFMRDQADAASWGILSYSSDMTLIEGCTFSGRSLALGGICFSSGTGTNHSADIVRANYFFGTPTGIYQNSSHNTLIHHNHFADNGANGETITSPCNIAGGTALMYNNWSLDTNLADFNIGTSGVEVGNICSDS